MSFLSTILMAQHPSKEALINKISITTDNNLKVDLLNKLSIFYIDSLSEFENAVNTAKEAIRIAGENNYKKGLAVSHKQLARIFTNNARNDEGKHHGNLSMKFYKEIDDKQGIAWCTWYKGIMESRAGNYVESILFFKKALNIANEISDSYEIHRNLKALSNTHRILGNYDLALKYDDEALTLKKKENDLDGIAKCYFRKGLNFYHKGDYPKSIEHYNKSLKINEQVNNLPEVMNCYNNIGVVYYDLKDYNSSLTYYNKAMELSKSTDNKYITAFLLNNIGEIYQIQKQYNKAVDYYNSGLEISNELNIKSLTPIIYFNLGDLHKAKKKYEKSLDFYNKALNGAELIQFDELIARYHWSVAEIYMLRSNLKKAREEGMLAFDHAKKSKNLETIKNSAQVLSKTHSKLNDYKEAYNFYVLYKNFSDSLINEKSQKNIYNLKISYETEKKDQEIQNLSQQNEAQKLRNIIITIAFILSVVLLLLLYSSFKMRRKILKEKNEKAEAKLEEQKAKQEQQQLEAKLKQEEYEREQEELKAQAELSALNNEKLQAELAHSHRELSSSTMYAFQRNEILGKIQELVKDIEPEKKDMKVKVQEVKQIIKSNIDNSDDWERLKLHFEKVHPNFFLFLHEKYPTLTQNELKHCAYLKIKLSNKEIASLLNVTPKSMQMARYRLKKKMDLGPDEDLISFIEKLL